MLKTTLPKTFYKSSSEHSVKIQIHHIHNHWLLTMNLMKNPSIIYIIDSFKVAASHYTEPKSQLKNLYFCEEQKLVYIFKMCMQQKNLTDCRLFSIATALSICLGYNLLKINYKISVMRSHLIKCISQRKMEMFPYF